MQHGSLQNEILSQQTPLTPEVGMGATEYLWSDRNPFTVIEVISPRKIVVQADIATRTDNNGMSDCQSYEFTPDHNGRKRTLTLRKNGKWIPQGEGLKGTTFGIGKRSKYHDYTF